jgi:hypothetical protein
MIKKFENFDNTKRELTLEMCEEIIFYTDASLFNLTDDQYVEFGLPEDLFYSGYYKEFKKEAKKLYQSALENKSLLDLIVDIYTKQRGRYKNLPNFFDVEDTFIDEMDEGFNIRFQRDRGENLNIILSNQKLKEDWKQFADRADNIIEKAKRIKLKNISVHFYNTHYGKTCEINFTYNIK